MKKPGLTLIEILVSIAILAVLIGIILPAVQAVRASADRAKSANQIKQLILATHHYASQNNDRVPSRVSWNPTTRNDSNTSLFFVAIAPHLEISLQGYPIDTYPPFGRVNAYTDPADISVTLSPEKNGPTTPNCSYAYNIVGATGVCTLGSFYGDGTTNTIAVTTHYMLCGIGTRQHGFDWTLGGSIKDDYERRATFTDEWHSDVLPVTTSGPIGNITLPSRAGATFQVKPQFEDCDPTVPQGFHYGGLHTAMFDGSVKFWRRGVSPKVFWAAVTPNGGEVDLD